MQPMEKLVAFIVARRSELGLSQRELGSASNVNPGTISSIEAGKVTKSPTNDTLEKLARGLRVDPQVLIDIARGRDPVAADDGVAHHRSALDPLMPRELATLPEPPDAEEIAIVRMIGADQLGDFALVAGNAFWQQRRGVRLRRLRFAADEWRDTAQMAGHRPISHLQPKRNTKYDHAPHLGDVAAGNPIVNPDWIEDNEKRF